MIQIAPVLDANATGGGLAYFAMVPSLSSHFVVELEGEKGCTNP